MAASRLERLLLVVVVVAGLLRLLLAALLPIGDDEAYYWLWSRHLAWSYPDHPPMVAVVIALSTRLFGDGVFGVRALNVVLGSVTPWLVYVVGRQLFDRETAARAGLFIAVLPVLGIGTIIASPDVPMAFFWTLSLWTGWQALMRGGRWWAAAGATTGLALLCKLTSAGLALGLIGAGATGGQIRRILRDRWVYVGALIAAALFAPVVLWNLDHRWFLADITLHRERWLAPRAIPLNLLFFAGGQVLYYGLITPLLVAACLEAWRRGREPVWRYLAWMSLPVLALMTVAAADARTKPHWPAPAYLAAAIALGALWPGWARARPRLVRGAAIATTVVTTALVVVLLLPWGRSVVDAGIGHYDRLAEAVARQAAAQAGPTVVLTDQYQAASQVAYRLRERIPVTTFYGAFVVWQRPQEWTGWHVVYAQGDQKHPGPDIQAMCRNLRQVDKTELGPNRPVKIFACDDLRFP